MRLFGDKKGFVRDNSVVKPRSLYYLLTIKGYLTSEPVTRIAEDWSEASTLIKQKVTEGCTVTVKPIERNVKDGRTNRK